MISILFALVLAAGPAPERLHCTLDAPRVLTCEVDTGKGFQLLLRADHPWVRHLSGLQPEVATVTLEEHRTKLCLKELRADGDGVKTAFNTHYGCVGKKDKRMLRQELVSQ